MRVVLSTLLDFAKVSKIFLINPNLGLIFLFCIPERDIRPSGGYKLVCGSLPLHGGFRNSTPCRESSLDFI